VCTAHLPGSGGCEEVAAGGVHQVGCQCLDLAAVAFLRMGCVGIIQRAWEAICRGASPGRMRAWLAQVPPTASWHAIWWHRRHSRTRTTALTRRSCSARRRKASAPACCMAAASLRRNAAASPFMSSISRVKTYYCGLSGCMRPHTPIRAISLAPERLSFTLTENMACGSTRKIIFSCRRLVLRQPNAGEGRVEAGATADLPWRCGLRCCVSPLRFAHA
jgi:hypothetical protein